MDIYQRLTQDHELHKDLATKILNKSANSEQRQALFRVFIAEVESHAAAAEQSIYAALMEKQDGKQQAQRSIAKHKECSNLIAELEQTKMSSRDWILKFEKLKAELEHRFDEEENEVFELARLLIDIVTAGQLADKFERCKQRYEESTLA